jgi:DNA-binding response OmpR family regulator
MASYKLLLADDSLTIQKVVELVLADEHFEIKAVGDGDMALEAIESFGPHIVLADIEMPKLNGYQLCEKIKNNAATVHIPVILLAGAFEPFDEDYSRSVGADDYIIKPFESQELISKVKSLLVGVDPAGGVTPAAVDVEEMMQASSVEGPKFDEQIPLAEDQKNEFSGTVEEEFATEASFSSTGKGFEEEMSAALQEQTVQASDLSGLIDTLALPAKEDVIEILRQCVEKRVSDILDSDSITTLSAALKEAVSDTLAQKAPEIIENVTKELVAEMFQSLRGEIVAAINRIVPAVAETVIKREIEKITVEL